MIQILNLGNSIGVVKNGKLTGYTFTSIESVTWEKDSVGYVVRITFLADNNCETEALLIPLRDITNISSWTDDVSGAALAVEDILSWISTSVTNPPALMSILSTLQDMTDIETSYVSDATGAVFLEVRVWYSNTSSLSGTPVYYDVNSNTPVVPVAPLKYLGSSPGIQKQSAALRVSASGTVVPKVKSISFASVGTANSTVSADGNVTTITLKPGETLSFDAGDQNNFFPASNFRYNSSTAGAELLIIYVY